jgi:hypothetical protein
MELISELLLADSLHSCVASLTWKLCMGTVERTPALKIHWDVSVFGIQIVVMVANLLLCRTDPEKKHVIFDMVSVAFIR